MKFIRTIAGIVSGSQSFDSINFSLPRAEVVLPWFCAVLGGFLVAVGVGFYVISRYMPPVAPFSEASQANSASGPMVSSRPTEGEFRSILARNLFNSDGQAAEEKKQLGCEVKKSDLPLKFTGVIFGGRAEASIVVLESTANKQADTFFLGEVVPGDAKIVDIERDKVFLQRNDCKEYLELEQPPLPKKRVAGERKKSVAPLLSASNSDNAYKEDGFERLGNTVAATRQWVERAVTVDFAKTLQDAKASPNQVNGEVRGFVLTRIRPDSVYEKMGMQDGDVIEAINGIELNDAARAIQTLNAMRNENNLEIRMKRNGQTSNLNVQVK